jgi:hypothetical protein
MIEVFSLIAKLGFLGLLVLALIAAIQWDIHK